MSALAQQNTIPTKYISLVDENLVIKKISAAPIYDNVNGVYSDKANIYLKNLIKSDVNWSYVDYFNNDKSLSLAQFDENPEKVKALLDSLETDAIITAFISKGSLGIKIQMNLYTQDFGKLLIREEYENREMFEVDRVNSALGDLYSKIKSKIPYSGIITSRRGNKVTLNIGSRSGLKNGDMITVAQILKINRHPKLNFMTGTEKEILGKITINQVDVESSYGEITLEKENGVIVVGSKLLPLNYLKYTSELSPVSNAYPGEDNPVEWLPAPIPQYGKITLMAGLSNFKESSVFMNGININANNSAALTFNFATELWITPEYYATLDLQQRTFNTPNNLTGSSPSKLNYSLNRIHLDFGYKYLIDGNFWGPKIFGSLGYFSHDVRMSDSVPTAFNSYTLTGMGVTAGGQFPITLKNDVALGSQVRFLFFDKFKERPVNSDYDSNDFSQFDIFGTYQYTNNINFKASLSYMNMQATFHGNGTKNPPNRSLEEKITTYLLGIEYLF
ncbi:MAG: hypothetical protein ACK41T_07820 [Pseudobdellovibrio sp.]